MAYKEQDWIHRTLQFIFGSIIGAISGFGVASSFPDYSLWIFVIGGAFFLGLVAAIFGDKLWYSLKGLWPW